MGFCSCTIKLLLVIFNLACALAGVIILIVGILMNTQGGSFKQLLSGEVTTTSIALMVLGGVIFLIAFFGCCGALREDTCMIQTYGVVLLIILIAEVAIGITAFVYKGKVEDVLDKEGLKFFLNYAQNNQTIDEIQKDLHCCGFHGPTDWPILQVPLSCCSKDVKICSQITAYSKGCKDAISIKGKSLLTTIGGVAVGLGVVELLGVLCAFYVAGHIRSIQRRGYA